MNSLKKVLLINTHLTYPNWSEGTLNASFHKTAKTYFEEKNYEILETIVEAGYDADEEVEKHLKADIMVLQTPVNWFSAPWIYKKYIDEVFNSGLQSKKFLDGDGRTTEDLSRQYGTGGNLKGKKFMVSATWNAPSAAFDDPNQILFQGRSTADFFIPITSNYRFCGVEILPDYNCFDIFKDGDITRDLESYPTHLKKVFNLK
jgi:modulator of drug activity B